LENSRKRVQTFDEHIQTVIILKKIKEQKKKKKKKQFRYLIFSSEFWKEFSEVIC